MIFSVKYRGIRFCIKVLALFILLNFAILFLCPKLVKEFTDQNQKFESHIFWNSNIIPTTRLNNFIQVDIYSRAPVIGEYLWNHLMEGKIESVSHIYKDNKTVNGVTFTFQSENSKRMSDSSNLVLIMDVSSQLKKRKEEMWLNNILISHAPNSIFLVILGDCNNQWIIPHLSSNGGSIGAVFVVRDKFITDDTEVFQWPLGTHRDFPLFFSDEIDILSPRPFVCTFFGETTKLDVLRLFKELNIESLCYFKTSNITGFYGDYIQAVSDSDLTLCSASEFGSETHCIYEAFSLGSVPVVEENAMANCDGDSLFLLKEHNAPFILVESLEDELGHVIADESKMNIQEKIARRATVLNWYSNFRHRMTGKFIRVLQSYINH